MFAVIYRSYLKLGKERDYQRAWRIVANHFVNHCGAIGSTLHKTDDGLWVAYSRWPNKATRDACWSTDGTVSTKFPIEIEQAIVEIKSCLDKAQEFPEIAMDVVDGVGRVKLIIKFRKLISCL